MATAAEKLGDLLSTPLHDEDDSFSVERPLEFISTDTGYSNAHKHINVVLGKASAHKCHKCGARASHWSYDHKDPKEDTGTDHGAKRPFSMDPKHYKAFCISCHKKDDLAHIAGSGAIATQIIELVNHNHTPTSAHPNPVGTSAYPSPVSRDPLRRSTPRIESSVAGGGMNPVDAVTWAEKEHPNIHSEIEPSAEDKFGPILKKLNSLNMVAKDQKTLVQWFNGPGRTSGLGGEFDAQGTWTGEWPSPTIKVWNAGAGFPGDHGNGYELLNFVHEWGHRVDWGGPSARFVSEAKSKPQFTGEPAGPLTPVKKAMGDFLVAATTNEHFLSSRRSIAVDPNFEEYWTRPTEIWARAYAQWATYKLNDPSLNSSFKKFDLFNQGKMQWPEKEFKANIGPQVEAVLKARGLLK